MGLLLTIAVLVAAVLQVSGLFDFYGALGLRSEIDNEGAPPVATEPGPVEPSPPEAVQPTPAPSEPTAPSEIRTTPGDRTFAQLDSQRLGQNPHAGRILALTSQARQAADQGRIEEAINLVNNALLFDRTDPDLVCMLAELYRQAGSYSQADLYADECDALRTARPGSAPEQGRQP